jgi:hypothetical protein
VARNQTWEGGREREGGYPGSREACRAGEEELVRRVGACCRRRGGAGGHVAAAWSDVVGTGEVPSAAGRW